METDSGNLRSAIFEEVQYVNLIQLYLCHDVQFCVQIKYLRVPDTLLDSVKEEQARARESGRGRGGHSNNPRGALFLFFSQS